MARRGNTAQGNLSAGINVGEGNVLEENHASGNSAHGINVDASSTLKKNKASGNRFDGIFVSVADLDTLIKKNEANFNKQDGIDADQAPDAAAGGGNKARGNGADDCAPPTLC